MCQTVILFGQARLGNWDFSQISMCQKLQLEEYSLIQVAVIAAFSKISKVISVILFVIPEIMIMISNNCPQYTICTYG